MKTVTNLIKRLEVESVPSLIGETELNIVIQTLRNNKLVKRLCFLATNSETATEIIVNYIQYYLENTSDQNYEYDPMDDVTVAALLMSLVESKVSAANFASIAVMRGGENMWWSARIAGSYLLKQTLEAK